MTLWLVCAVRCWITKRSLDLLVLRHCWWNLLDIDCISTLKTCLLSSKLSAWDGLGSRMNVALMMFLFEKPLRWLQAIKKEYFRWKFWRQHSLARKVLTNSWLGMLFTQHVSLTKYPPLFTGTHSRPHHWSPTKFSLFWNFVRRFKDFADLNSQVKQNFKGHHLRTSLPAFPEKVLKFTTDHMDPAFIQDRKAKLDMFLNDLVLIPHVADMTCTKAFLGLIDQVVFAVIYWCATINFL